jgi:hypothetical protein
VRHAHTNARMHGPAHRMPRFSCILSAAVSGLLTGLLLRCDIAVATWSSRHAVCLPDQALALRPHCASTPRAHAEHDRRLQASVEPYRSTPDGHVLDPFAMIRNVKGVCLSAFCARSRSVGSGDETNRFNPIRYECEKSTLRFSRASLCMAGLIESRSGGSDKSAGRCRQSSRPDSHPREPNQPPFNQDW